jgi:hypothetical protein
MGNSLGNNHFIVFFLHDFISFCNVLNNVNVIESLLNEFLARETLERILPTFVMQRLTMNMDFLKVHLNLLIEDLRQFIVNHYEHSQNQFFDNSFIISQFQKIQILAKAISEREHICNCVVELDQHFLYLVRISEAAQVDQITCSQLCINAFLDLAKRASLSDLIQKPASFL